MKPPGAPIVAFRQSDLELFTRLSHDRNPLHIDGQYARRTPFGECVVYGVLGALGALKEPLKGAPIKLRKLTAHFKRPLFTGVPYETGVTLGGHGKLSASLGRGGVERLRLDAEYEVGGVPWSAAPASEGKAPRTEPARIGSGDVEVGRALSGEYEPASSCWEELKKQIAFKYGFVPPFQLSALLWASYFVGMEMPGRQALFLSCAIDFLPGADFSQSAVDYRARVTRFDPQTSTLAVAAELSSAKGPAATVQLEAAVRPPPVEYTLGVLEARVGRAPTLQGKVALVTGSSRGLGSLTALGCALRGAEVVLHCREGREEVDRVAAQIAAWGAKATVVQGDVEKEETWLALRAAAESRGRGLDLFVNNAFPALVPTAFAELSLEGLDRFLRMVRSTAMGLQVLMPALIKAGGTVVDVSSEATVNPPREFSHYVAGKAAIEGLIRCLAKEYESVRFVTVRPPRLLTDMTNGLVGAFQGRSPEGVVAALLAAVSQTGGGNYAVVDRFD